MTSQGAGIAAETFVHIFTLHFEGAEQVLVNGVGVNTTLGEKAKKTLRPVAYAKREGAFHLDEKFL